MQRDFGELALPSAADASRQVYHARTDEQMILGWTLGLIGGVICLVNFYLSFLRYPLFRAFGGKQDDWHWVSGFPWVGSLFVGIAWIVWLRGLDSLTLDVLCWTLVALDTGGIHWFILSLTIQAMFGNKNYNA